MRSTRSRNPKETENEEDPQADVEFDEDEAEGGDDEITRCVCGNEELKIPAKVVRNSEIDEGFFIQCESCSVWQHGYCVGILDAKDAPNQYWCELCRPDLHNLVVNGDSEKRSVYVPVAEKRMSKSDHKDESRPRRERVRSQDAEYEQMLKKALEESAKEMGVKAEEANLSSLELPKTRSRHVTKPTEDVKEEIPVEENQNPIPEDVSKKPSSPIEQVVEQPKKVKKPNGKHSKPPKPKKAASTNPQVSKPKLPSAKISISEMRKRVGGVLEFVGRNQMELLNQKNERTMLNQYIEKDAAMLGIDKAKSEQELVSNFDSTLRKMESLTEKLLSWEEKYGKYGDKLY